MVARLLRRTSAGARALAVALAVLSLGAPGFAGWGECREPGCTPESSRDLASADFAAPGAASCPCPASCETEETGGCGQACDRERDSLSARQSQRIRRGAAERSSPAIVAGVAIDAAPDARALWRSPGGTSASASTSAPLFIRHRSIIR